MEENTQSAPKQSKNMMPLILGALVLLLVGGGVYVATMNRTPQTTNQQTTDTANDSDAAAGTNLSGSENANTNDTPDTPMDMEGDVKEFTVNGNNFSFDPAEIRVKKGDTVRIVFNNKVGFHDWVLDEFNAKTKQLQAGQSETIEFVADQAGTFEYYCSVGKHREMGMKGNLIVEE